MEINSLNDIGSKDYRHSLLDVSKKPMPVQVQ